MRHIVPAVCGRQPKLSHTSPHWDFKYVQGSLDIYSHRILLRKDSSISHNHQSDPSPPSPCDFQNGHLISRAFVNQPGLRVCNEPSRQQESSSWRIFASSPKSQLFPDHVRTLLYERMHTAMRELLTSKESLIRGWDLSAPCTSNGLRGICGKIHLPLTHDQRATALSREWQGG